MGGWIISFLQQLEWVFYLIAALVLLPYFLNPILLRIRFRGFYDPFLEAIPREALSPEVKNYLDSTDNDFKQAGFHHCTYAKMQNFGGTSEIYLSLWINRQEGISGSAFIAYRCRPNRTVTVFAKSISLMTRFSETTQFETTNSGVPTPLVRMPLRPSVQLPTTMNFKERLSAHQTLAKRFHPDGERLLPLEGRELAMLKRKLVETHDHQIRSGRWTMDTPKVYRLTWKGALINGWQHAWPVKGIRKWLLDKRANDLRNSLGY